MTVDEKREKVFSYCYGVLCSKCVLTGEKWEHVLKGSLRTCLNIKEATEAELDRALELIGEASEPYVEPVKEVPEDCVEPAAEDAELVIKIKSSRKINCLHVEFAEEE